MSILANGSATGTLTSNTATAGYIFKGGQLFVGASGTWGGGALTLKVSYDGGTTYVAVSDSVLVADGSYIAELPDCQVNLTLTGATSPSIVWSLSARTPV